MRRIEPIEKIPLAFQADSNMRGNQDDRQHGKRPLVSVDEQAQHGKGSHER